jgi:histidinol-phosphate/aromatic aminotransferase/cobyric acid decarboxylase-like protein
MGESAARPPQHGGLRHDELEAAGLGPGDVLDVSVNVNPYGPCGAVRRAIAAAAIHRYPDPTAAPARHAIGERLGVDRDRVVVGNGAVDLLWTLARARLRRGDRVVVVEPAFSELRAAAERIGASVVEHRARPDDDFAFDPGALDALLREARPSLLYLCTPSNPAGVCVPRGDLEALAARHPGTLCVADVSFRSMSARHAEGGESPSGPVVWVRSLTKDHALAGLRVGFAVAPPDVAAAVDAERPPWSVNALAQAAAIAAMTDEAELFLRDCRERLAADHAYFTDGLRRLALRVHPSETMYVLVELGPRAAAADLRGRLLRRHGVLVRDATSFGLPRHVRLAVRPRADADRALAALRTELRP